MDKTKIFEIEKWAQAELDRSVNFWLENGIDKINGGVYTCLNNEGKIYSTDKSVWMQGRCAWTFARLCNQYGKKQEWMDASRSCLEFMEKYCFNKEAGNRMYFTVTADGKPLRQRRYAFSESFYIIANAEFYGVSGEKVYIERARKVYDFLYSYNNALAPDPTGLGPKTIAETRSGRGLANPMIFLNTTAIMRKYDPENKEKYDRYSAECAEEIVKYFYKPELKCTLESVGVNGEPQLDYSQGRVVNPGHDIECSWFLLDEAIYQNNAELMESAKAIFMDAFNGGWDKTYGGLLMFIDCLGNPPEAYEHDMKLWWPHNELLIAAMKFYKLTGDEKFMEIFDMTREYCEKFFSDKKNGEWYGYLRRDGMPTEPIAKGSTFKGPFHVPRCFMELHDTIKDMK